MQMMWKMQKVHYKRPFKQSTKPFKKVSFIATMGTDIKLVCLKKFVNYKHKDHKRLGHNLCKMNEPHEIQFKNLGFMRFYFYDFIYNQFFQLMSRPRMCQVILGRLITPIFVALYFCTLYWLPRCRLLTGFI